MADPSLNRIALDRTILAVIGALAGAAVYGLVEVLPDFVTNERLILLAVTATGGFFAAFLAATGPLSFTRAGLAALITTLPAALLLYWASFRFADVEDYLETGAPVIAHLVIIIITLPFLIAMQRPGEGWRNYAALFTQSWNIVVRYAAAWVFVGVFWAVIMLSNELFKLVGLDIIERLLDMEAAPYVLTGAVLGLAMAVVVELSEYISPFLILRLLRLLVPVVLVVTLVFLVALPIRGLSDLFGGLSAAATLLAMAVGIATLITSAIDKTNDDAVDARIMTISTQGLALALPVIGGLAFYAIWLRVKDYGLSPDRLAAGTLALIVIGYGVLYAVAVLGRRNWMARIRSANIIMAIVTVLVGIAWLSPVVNPQRLTASNQVARLSDGRITLDEMDLWFVTKDLGVAGSRAAAELQTLDHPDAAALQAQLARISASDSRFAYKREITEIDLPAMRADLLAKLVVKPEGETLPAEVFDDFPARKIQNFLDGCEIETPAGNAGCIVVVADFLDGRDGQEGILIYSTSSSTALIQVLRSNREVTNFSRPLFLNGRRADDINPGAIDALYAGAFELGPTAVMSLRVGNALMMLEP